MRGAVVLATLALTLTAAKSDPLAGRTAGPARECLDDFDASSGPAIVDQNTIIYRPTSRRLWVVHPDGPCPALRPDSALIVIHYGGQTCAGDRFRVRNPESPIPSNFCRFGKFIPYDRTAPAR